MITFSKHIKIQSICLEGSTNDAYSHYSMDSIIRPGRLKEGHCTGYLTLKCSILNSPEG